MSTENLISCAKYLLDRPENERSQADTDRAASTLYYAVFHEICFTCANLFMGPKPDGHGRRAWQQMYRALEHKRCCAKCKNKEILGKFPEAIINFGNLFVQLQEKRHQSDYDPLVNLAHTDVVFLIDNIRNVIDAFRNAPEVDLKAFCVFVLFENREDPARKEEEKKAKELAAAEKIKQQMANKKN